MKEKLQIQTSGSIGCACNFAKVRVHYDIVWFFASVHIKLGKIFPNNSHCVDLPKIVLSGLNECMFIDQ